MPPNNPQSAIHNPQSILVIKPSSLGDVVHTLPAVACLKKRWPQARLTWLVNPEWAPLLADNPNVDEVVEFPRAKFRGPMGWLRAARWFLSLRSRIKADLVLDFQGLLRSALIARRSRRGKVWGLSDAREGASFFYNHTVAVPDRDEPVHAVDRYLSLASAVGADTTPPLVWHLPAGSAPRDVQLPERFILLHPFSRGEGKSLSVEQVTELCQGLGSVAVVLAGRSTEKVPALENVTNLLNLTTLPELCWLIRRADFVVSVDSGPMHLAAALTPNVLSLHTWSDPRQVGPYEPQAWVWQGERIGRIRDFPTGERCPRAKLPEFILRAMMLAE